MIYIISYPRSGNTFVRYIVEFLTGLPTKDLMAKKIVSREQSPLLFGNKKIFSAYKRHDFKGIRKTDKIIFVYRNYKEVLVRHNKNHRKITEQTMISNLLDQDGTYYGLLKRYEKFTGKKMHIKYEELVKYPVKIAHDICTFINGNFNKVDEFRDNKDAHINKSLSFYPRSETKGNLKIKHSDNFKDLMPIWEKLIKKHDPVIYKKYLSNY